MNPPELCLPVDGKDAVAFYVNSILSDCNEDFTFQLYGKIFSNVTQCFYYAEAGTFQLGIKFTIA